MAFLRLVTLSVLMLLSTLLASSIPYLVPLAPDTVHHISTYSSGLLVGAALTVVIPEGVHAVYQATSLDDDEGESTSGWIGASLLAGFILMYLIESVHSHPSSSPTTNPSHRPRNLRHVPSRLSELEPLAASSSASSNRQGVRDSNDDYEPRDSTRPDVLLRGSSDWTIRMDDHEALERNPGANHADDDVDYVRDGDNDDDDDRDADEWTRPERRPSRPTNRQTPRPSSNRSSAWSTVLGLVAHSLADGISLGASSLSTSSPHSHSRSHSDPVNLLHTRNDSRGGGGGGGGTGLSTIVFLAIMLHKAPTAFALSSLLKSHASTPPSPSSSSTTTTTTTRKMPPAFVRKSLVAFSLAAPLGALVTYVLIELFGSSSSSSPSSPSSGTTLGWYTGIALVFSGGTFLFVATQSVQDSTSNDHAEDESVLVGGGGGGGRTRGGKERKSEGQSETIRTLLVLSGMITPGILSRLVGHGH
ncbi:hypothetical protein JCM10212_006473 [Sporobolomyces blumeae]